MESLPMASCRRTMREWMDAQRNLICACDECLADRDRERARGDKPTPLHELRFYVESGTAVCPHCDKTWRFDPVTEHFTAEVR